MNVFAGAAYSESVSRLALGIEPIDLARGARATREVIVAMEGVPEPISAWRRLEPWQTIGELLPRMLRHPSGRFVVLYEKDTRPAIDIRLFDRQRRFVPRRLRVRIPTEAVVMAPETDPLLFPVPSWRRIFRPALFPGANYPTTDRATGLRGRVIRDGKPMAWARIEARIAGSADVVARAHGDDRGEFLLLIPPPGDPAQAWTRTDPLRLDIVVLGPMVPAGAAQGSDPLSNLPQESAVPPMPGTVDRVQAGTATPTDYRESVTGIVGVRLRLGLISSAGFAPFEFRSGP